MIHQGKNITYNHKIYKDGYRYYGLPIGSPYDADSKIVIVNYDQITKNNTPISIRLMKASLNYNNGNTFFIDGLSEDVSIIETNINKALSENFRLRLIIQYSDFINNRTYDNLNYTATLEYRW